MNRFEEQYQESGFESQRRYPNESLIAFMAANYFKFSKEKRRDIKILELGCGSGANLWMIAREGFDAYGIDFSPTGIQYCKDMLDSWSVEANLTVGDMVSLPYDDNSFDAIVDVVSMQHLNLDQHKQSWGEVFRCLKNGGCFFSYHLSKKSDSNQRFEANIVDECTIQDIPHGYPLANNGQTCFISDDITVDNLTQIGFKKFCLEKVLRSYEKQSKKIEYLSITAVK